MKRIVLIIVFILLAYSVYSIYGGETQTIFDGECAELIVNITIDPSQDENEYVLEPCTVLKELKNNIKSFKCECVNGRTTLNLTSAINSVGNYTITTEQHIWKDNETIEPIVYNTTNPTSNNITTEIRLPNNMTVNRIIPPGEELVYIETKEEYVIIPESNVTFQLVSTDSMNINIQATSSGVKCFDIYTPIGAPYSITVNGNLIGFTYNSTSRLIRFCIQFSTKDIAITWVIPEEPEPAPSRGRGGIGKSPPIVDSVDLEKIPEFITENGTTIKLAKGSEFSFLDSKGNEHVITISVVYEERVLLTITSEAITMTLQINETKKLDRNKDGIRDIAITLLGTKYGRASLNFKKLAEKMEAPDVVTITEPTEEPGEIAEEAEEEIITEIEPERGGFWRRMAEWFANLWRKIRTLFGG